MADPIDVDDQRRYAIPVQPPMPSLVPRPLPTAPAIQAPQPSEAPAISIPAQPMPNLGAPQTARPELVNRQGHPITAGRVAGIPGHTDPTSDGSPGTYNNVNPHLSKIASLWSDADNIHNPFLRVLGKIGAGAARAGDSILSAAAPRLAAAIPGTTMQHTLAEQNLAKENQQTADTRETNAKAGLEESKPELAQAKMDLETEKQNEAAQKNQNTDQSTLAAHGYKRGPDGNIAPLSYEEMSPQQQAVTDLKGSQEELADAQKALKEAQTKNLPAQMQMAQQRINNAQKNAGNAAKRLGLSEAIFNARYHGTDANGQALPGAMELDDNTPVGSVFQQNVRPTGTERNKADLANSAHDQLQTIRSIVEKRSDIFGPAAGRKTDFTVWLGSQDPDAQRFRAARTIAGDHLAGVFGGRSEAALTALDSAIGQFKDNPAAVIAGIDQLDKANNAFQKAGTAKVADGHGGATSPSHTNPPATPSGMGVSLKAAMALPQNKGKSEADVRKDIEAHGHKVSE